MTAPAPGGLLDGVLPPESVRRVTLPNGLRVLTRRDASAPVVAIVTYVRAGYFDETDDIVGIAHVLEHMYFKGTPTRGVGDIARETKASGGYLNAATIYDHTHYYTVLPSSGFETGLAVQADAYANSLIDAGELSRELEVIIEEAKRKADNPAAVATETLFALLHDRHRIRRWRIGREPGLRALTRDHVTQFYRRFYRPSNTTIAIVGDVDPERALLLAAERYGVIPDAPVERDRGPEESDAVDPAFRFAELNGDVQQSEVVLGWRTPALAHDDTPPLDLLAAVLAGGRASRLYRAVRDRRLASSVTAYNYTPTELGIFVVHATARPERAQSALRAAWDQVARARAGEISHHEVERARRMLEAHWLRRLETMEGQADYLAAWESFGGWQRGSDYVNALLGASPEQLAEVASRWLTPERAGLVIYRPSAAPASAASPQEMRELLSQDPPAPVEPIARPAVAPVIPGGPRAWRLEREEEGVHVFRTASGAPMLVQRRPGAIAYLGWFVHGGALHESARDAGITSLMARTAVKGTERRDTKRIAEDAEFAGGILAAGTTSDEFHWTISVPTHRLADAAELLADVVQRPSFADDALEAERAVALADVASLRDDMYRWPMRLAVAAAWGEHPYGRSVLGTEDSLAAIDAGAVRRWHAARAIEARGVLVCVADVDPADAAALGARHFTAIREGADVPSTTPPWPSELVQRSDGREKAQSALAMLFPGPSRHDDARFDASLIAGVASGLGGRFFDELRDRQSLAYTVMASPMPRRHAGAFAAYIAMSPEKEEAAREGLLRQFDRLRESPVRDEELARARTYALGTWAIRRESAGNVLYDLADAWLLGRSLREITDYERRIKAVTARGMMELAQRCFDPDRRVEGIVRGVGKSV